MKATGRVASLPPRLSCSAEPRLGAPLPLQSHHRVYLSSSFREPSLASLELLPLRLPEGGVSID